MSEQSTSSDSFSNALNSILSDPQMLSTITAMAQKLKSDSEGANAAPTNASEEESPSAVEAVTEKTAPPSLPDALGVLAPLLSGGAPKHSKRDEDRACLLRALKPYLSHDRSQAIDYIIRFSSVADVLKNLS